MKNRIIVRVLAVASALTAFLIAGGAGVTRNG